MQSIIHQLKITAVQRKLSVMKIFIVSTSVMMSIILGFAQIQVTKIKEHFIFSNRSAGAVIEKRTFENITTNTQEAKPQNPWFYGWEVKVSF